jgi:general secretion pathway protein K
MEQQFIAAAGEKSESPDKDSGFVLVSVIWIAGLLAVVATAFAITVRSHTLAGSNVIYNTRAESVADGAALATALRLAMPANAYEPLKLNGEPAYCQWSSDIAVAISIQDQGGLVDLNTASPALLSSLLRGLGADEAKSAEIFSALQDFRDPDSQSASGGAEPAVFQGKAYGPKNAPLAIPEEIDQVPELDDALFHKLMPFVTVYSQQPGIDLSSAPQKLLDLLGTRESSLRFASPSPAKIFSIDVIAELKNGSRYRRQALVSLLRQPDRPFAILAWRRGGDPGETQPLPASGPACFN